MSKQAKTPLPEWMIDGHDVGEEEGVRMAVRESQVVRQEGREFGSEQYAREDWTEASEARDGG